MAPHTGANFRVDIGGRADARDAAGGFAEVIFPPFDAAPEADAPPPRLVLRRGVTGALDLARWWDQARRGKAPQRRTVTVSLLDAEHETVVMRWRFLHARPVRLGYASLDAGAPAVLMETIELAYERVEIG